MKKVTNIIVLSLVVLMLSSSLAFAAQDIKVYVDGAQMSFPDQKPFVNLDNRTLVPVRFVSETLGAEVDWNELTKTVQINHEGKTILLQIDLNAATVGLRIVTLDTAPAIFNSRTMVPLRFVSECLGAQVEWKAAQQAVYINTAGSDQSLVDSDLELYPKDPGDKPDDLAVCILYKYTTPVEPQLADLKELLEKRFGGKAQEIVDYVATKKTSRDLLLSKDWVIDGKNIRVSDATGSVAVTVWG